MTSFLELFKMWLALIRERTAIRWLSAKFFDSLSGIDCGYEPFDDQPYEDA